MGVSTTVTVATEVVAAADVDEEPSEKMEVDVVAGVSTIVTVTVAELADVVEVGATVVDDASVVGSTALVLAVVS